MRLPWGLLAYTQHNVDAHALVSAGSEISSCYVRMKTSSFKEGEE